MPPEPVPDDDARLDPSDAAAAPASEPARSASDAASADGAPTDDRSVPPTSGADGGLGGGPTPPDDGDGGPPAGGEGPPSGSTPGDGSRPGVREQLGRVRVAARALIDAHLALLRAEMAVIGDQVKQIAAFVGGIVVLALYAISLLAIGGTLFLGEWIFGSIGWGVLHGTLLAIGIILALALLIIDAPRPLILRPLAWGAAVGVVLTIVLGLNVPRQLSEAAADFVISNGVALDPQYAPAVVAMVVFAVVFALVGLYLGARSEGGLGAFQGLVVGALFGALFGLLFGGMRYGWQGAAAIGVTAGLITWIALMGWRASRANLDPQARFERLWPRETYETALETKTWLEQEWTKRLPRPGSK